MLAKQRQKDAIQLVKLKQPRKMIMGDARLFHSLLPPISSCFPIRQNLPVSKEASLLT